ncbi:hypothetical protein BJX99DRAFT_92736 [Aspergillus californicus]
MRYFVSLLPFILSAVAGKTSESIGCFSDVADFESQRSSIFESVDHCVDLCDEADFNYAALQGDSCLCGKASPAQDALVSDDRCDEACPGYAKDTCGGDGAWSVYGIGGVRPSVWLSTSTTASTSTATDSTSTTASETSVASIETSSASTTVTDASEHSSSTTSLLHDVSVSPASTSPASTSTSTSVEPTPTENKASRRYRILF